MTDTPRTAADAGFDLLALIMATPAEAPAPTADRALPICRNDSHPIIVRTSHRGGYTERRCGCSVPLGEDEEFARYA
jgi:hypothetical protein